MEKITEPQKKALLALLDTENKTAYDCKVSMNTIYALNNRGLIERINYNKPTWFGWERTQFNFKLTEKGETLAKSLSVDAECPNCKGTGRQITEGQKKCLNENKAICIRNLPLCEKCKGLGKVSLAERHPNSWMNQEGGVHEDLGEMCGQS